mmetsp:Transcript_36782/g.113781  ORF Transcript_36782/g.113781 Transcript_36782/m.113781 type:complete len:200 (+) Transcript_36782:1169-1768(+)
MPSALSLGFAGPEKKFNAYELDGAGSRMVPCGAAATSTPQQHRDATLSCNACVRKSADARVVKNVPGRFSQTSVRFWSVASARSFRASDRGVPLGTPSPARWNVQRLSPKTTALPACASAAINAPPQGEKPGVSAVAFVTRGSHAAGNTRQSWPRCGSPLALQISSTDAKSRGATCRRVMDHAVRSGRRSSSTSCWRCT